MWPTLEPMQVVAKFATAAGGALWWPNLQSVHAGGQNCTNNQ